MASQQPEKKAQKPERIGFDALMGLLRQFVSDNYPGDEAITFDLGLKSGGKISLVVPGNPADEEGQEGRVRVSQDGRLLHWFGQRHRFTGPQGKAVLLLVEAYQAGQRDVATAVLIEAAGLPPGSKMADLFGGSTAFRDLILSYIGRGQWRLVEPDEPDC